jgi:hypothetical protein
MKMINNLKIVSENCKRGTTTVWDAEQVEKVIEILKQGGNSDDRHIKN